MGSTDMAPFFARYDRRLRRLMVTALSASLVLSAVIFSHSVLAAGGAGAKPAAIVWWLGIAGPPVFIGAWWVFTELMAWGRRKTSQPDGSLPTNVDDARNGKRVANAGFVFTIGLIAAGLAQQALIVPMAYGYPLGYSVGHSIARVIMVVVGAVMIYLGNLWPRVPTPRAPERQAAIQMKTHRVIGWLMVILGLLIVLLGLFLPLLQPHA
jgi:uncharacterized membrane protein